MEKDEHIDGWDRVDSPGDPHLDGQLIFDKGAKAI